MRSEDPTSFPIQFDPREQRMRGVARHGYTPFDVPFISQITDNLWQGGCQNGLILPDFIKYVVSLYMWEEYTRGDDVEFADVEMYDDLEAVNLEQLDVIAKHVNECRAKGVTLVHCQAGLNRSSLIAARALMLGDGMTAVQAINLLRAKRSPAVLCNPNFEEFLLELDNA